MRICINYLERKDALIAPVIFAHRLGRELEKHKDVKIVDRSEKHDILLAIIRDDQIADSHAIGAKVVQRLDGVYHELDNNILTKNKLIRKTFDEVDAVIYQSDFSRKLVNRYFGQNDGLEFIIHNGVDPFEYPASQGKGEGNFLAVAKWAGRTNKRLKSIVEGFDYANFSGTKLKIVGPVDEGMGSYGNVEFTGPIPNSEIPSLYRNTNCLIHLCYDDNCPNAVAEALVSEVPVICTSSGGTPELVKDSGEIIQEDNYDLEPNWRAEIPDVPRDKVAEAIHAFMGHRNYRFPRNDLYMESCANNYIEAFEKVLS